MRRLFLQILLAILIVSEVSAQEAIVAGIYGNYSAPVAGLSDWFKPAVDAAVSFGIADADDGEWTYEAIITASRFDRENLSGYAAGRLQLQLEHIAVLYSARYRLTRWGNFTPYFTFAFGPHYWKGIRGKIDANDELGIPEIKERVLEEWNWGARAGAALQYQVAPDWSVDLIGYYRLIIGDLWPTLQEHIELESVSGFQTLNLSAGIRYNF